MKTTIKLQLIPSYAGNKMSSTVSFKASLWLDKNNKKSVCRFDMDKPVNFDSLLKKLVLEFASDLMHNEQE